MTAKKRIIIIGAGISGLAAANELAGFTDVTVIEARDRLGGRIWTDRSWGKPLELGAQVVHGATGNPIMDLVQKAHPRTIAAEYSNFYLYDADGKLVDDAIAAENREEFESVVTGITKAAPYLSPHLSAEHVVDQHPQTRAVPPPLRQWFKESQVIYSGADLAFHAGRYYSQENEFEGPNLVFPEGYDQVLKNLTRLDYAHILTGHQVRVVRWNPHAVCVDTDHGEFLGDCALITLPLGVLQAGIVRFEPDLPQWKRAALERLGMGVLDMVFLDFGQVFWPADRDFIGIASPDAPFTRFVNRFRLTQAPVLVALAGGNKARKMEILDDDEIVAQAMTSLRVAFPGAPQPVRTRITRWATDPLACGSYSYIPTGASPDDYEILSQPVADRLFFAGEATNKQFPCTVHGAYLSGLREAARLLA
ncbi:MAG TPA: FAD-dependent oxidoreductase [Verrucomicrobiae bacterium]|jgi:monoamine oxidase|nr:FAD-dependent oxidoreductase [Verrucomicrobiae bacterium]